MRKSKRTVIIMAALGILLGGMLTGCFAKKLLVDDQMLDGPGMVNTDAPLMDLLSDNWATSDGRWTASIDGYALKLALEGKPVYENKLYFTFDGKDVNNKTELSLYYSDLQSDDGTISGVIKQFYTENGLLYMEVAYQDGTGENVVFEKSTEEIQVLDGDRTYVDNAPLLLALQGSWASGDDVWKLTIEDYTLTILHEDKKVFCEDYNFVFYGGSDINEHTELELPAYELCRDGAECFTSIEYLYIENGALHMEVSDEDHGSESVTFEKSAE